ncbi:MAG: hypothetical protein M1818_001916 [Claussenomyces sp. TS43310]|nr:MAG: hypothetical protein M1818_001916 [Claussenomyces sp. TS43310]
MPRRHANLRALVVPSGSATPTSSRANSVYNSGVSSEEDEGERSGKKNPFDFLNLPSELRNKIYGLVFSGTPPTIDLDPDNYRLIFRRFPIFLVNRQVYAESSHAFYSTHVVRLFPCHPGRFFKTKKPLLARLSPRCRSSISSLELRLGPGFAAPPRGWVINEGLGLADCVNVRVVRCFVQVDPSLPLFAGYRKGDDGFYERFSQDLLERLLQAVPSVVEVQFDAYPGVERLGPMMAGLLSVAKQHGKLISWGPERGWGEEADAHWKDAVLASAISDLSVADVPVLA